MEWLSTVLDETYTLPDGVKTPKLGLGIWFIDDGQVAEAVRAAVRIGYRNIDTAQAYGNERGVGEGLRTADVSRDELFVSTKLAAEIKDHVQAVEAVEAVEAQNAEVQAMAGKYGVSVAQLCIRYTLQLGTVSLPKTADPEHMRTNANADVDFEISGDDMDALRGLRDVDYGEHSAFPVCSSR